MSETRKILGQIALTSETLTDVYLVPANTQAVNSTIFISNTSGSSRSFRISVANAGEADTLKQYLYYDIPIPKNTSFVFTTGITLNTGDVIRAYASGSGISVNIFGVEIS